MQILYLIPAIALLVGLALPLASRPKAGAFLVIAVFCCETLFISVPPINIGVQIYVSDIAFLLLFVAAVLHYTVDRVKLSGARWIVVCLYVLFFVSLARGLAMYEINEAGNESREWFYFLSGVVYFSGFDLGAQPRRWVITAWLIASGGLVCTAIIRWVALESGAVIFGNWVAMAGPNSRVLNAAQGDFLVVAFFISIFLNMANAGPRWQGRAFYVLGPIILLLQHRTVWVEMIIGLLWLGLHDQRMRKRAAGAVVGMAVVGVLFAAFVFGHRSEVAAAELRDSATNDDTIVWRAEGWYQLLFHNPALNLTNGVIGEPFGTGFDRVIGGDLVVVPPHNWYVEAFLRLGAIGLFLLARMYLLGMQRLKRLSEELRGHAYPDVRFWRLVLLLQSFFFLTYGASYEQSILTGIALATMRLKPSRPATEEVAIQCV